MEEILKKYEEKLLRKIKRRLDFIRFSSKDYNDDPDAIDLLFLSCIHEAAHAALTLCIYRELDVFTLKKLSITLDSVIEGQTDTTVWYSGSIYRIINQFIAKPLIFISGAEAGMYFVEEFGDRFIINFKDIQENQLVKEVDYVDAVDIRSIDNFVGVFGGIDDYRKFKSIYNSNIMFGLFRKVVRASFKDPIFRLMHLNLVLELLRTKPKLGKINLKSRHIKKNIFISNIMGEKLRELD